MGPRVEPEDDRRWVELNREKSAGDLVVAQGAGREFATQSAPRFGGSCVVRGQDENCRKGQAAGLFTHRDKIGKARSHVPDREARRAGRGIFMGVPDELLQPHHRDAGTRRDIAHRDGHRDARRFHSAACAMACGS
jgi:hypothetical protein